MGLQQMLGKQSHKPQGTDSQSRLSFFFIIVKNYSLIFLMGVNSSITLFLEYKFQMFVKWGNYCPPYSAKRSLAVAPKSGSTAFQVIATFLPKRHKITCFLDFSWGIWQNFLHACFVVVVIDNNKSHRSHLIP